MDPDRLSRRHELAESVRFYLDPQKTKYVHLMDGGIADNLAMRGMINAILVLTADETVLRQLNVSAIRRILLISADGQAVNTAQGSTEPTLSSISKVFAAVSGTQIDSYNFETMILAREQLGVLRDALKKLRCETGPMVNGYACDDVEASLVHLSLDDVTDSGERQHLQQIPTGLTLEDKDIDELVAAGEADVRNSPDLQAFRASLTSRPAS
jgi:NTE family protein